MQAQCQFVVYTEHKLCCLASNTSAKIFFFSHSEYHQHHIKLTLCVDGETFQSVKPQQTVVDLADFQGSSPLSSQCASALQTAAAIR